jgi:cytochrome c551/c552
MSRGIFPTRLLSAGLLLVSTASLSAAPARVAAADGFAGFTGKYCTACHNSAAKTGGLDLSSLAFDPADAANFVEWVKVHDRLSAGEMPPKGIPQRPDPAAQQAFLKTLTSSLTAAEQKATAAQGRVIERRLNAYEYENALRDLLRAPWLQVKGLFPEDGEAYRFNKSSSALDVSHVHIARYMGAADYAIREMLSVESTHPPTATTRYYAREQKTVITKINSPRNQAGDRAMYPILGLEPQPKVFAKTDPMTVGAADPATREKEAAAWVASNYVTGFTYRWDQFKAPVSGRYHIRFKGYTLWVAPLPEPKSYLPDWEHISAGRRDEAINVYTRDGVLNRHVGSFDLTPEPAVHDVGDVWLVAGETLTPDASRLYRSRPNNFRNPLMAADGAPAVAFNWMEVEGPLYDNSTFYGYKLLFGDLPLQSNLEVKSTDPLTDEEQLMRAFLRKAYQKPRVDPVDVKRFVDLVEERRAAGLSFTQAMIAGYTAVLASPEFVYLREKPGRLDEYALATRLSLFLWNSLPDEALLRRAEKGELSRPAVLRAETERMLADPKARRFVDAFLDYWIDLRKMEDSTPSSALYNDYYLDDALTEAAQAESQLFFGEMLRRDLPVRNVVDSKFTFLNERLAVHYGIPSVKGVAMRRVDLAPDSLRGGVMTQASVLKVTANGTTTSPVLRGKWIMERILGYEIPPPPVVPAVDPDIRGAVTIRQQLDKHRSNASCATCHSKIDPAGFALESFDVMGGWRDRYRGVDEKVPAVSGRGKNGQPFAFHYALPVDSSGVLPDGRRFADVRGLKKLLLADERVLAMNIAKQLVIYATGAPIRFSDREQVERIVDASKSDSYGLRTIVHQVIESDLFRNK